MNALHINDHTFGANQKIITTWYIVGKNMKKGQFRQTEIFATKRPQLLHFFPHI